jgi:transglutaminase-like putative cysteine protease
MSLTGPRVGLRSLGPSVPYEITLEPQSVAVLPVLEATADLPATAPRVDGLPLTPLADLSWLAGAPIRDRVRYQAVAWPQFRYGQAFGAQALRSATELPPGMNPRLMAWADALRRQPRLAQADARTLAAELMAHIRTQDYRYTLSPGGYGTHAVDEFWFDRRAGFCEHFTAAFVVAMRAMDVPARVVLGYQGADLSPVDGYHVVRHSHAHAWAEYWQAGEGWLRADPTAAVAPERIDRSAPLRPAPGLMAGALGSFSPDALLRLREAWEAMNNRWNQWVLDYSRQQQFDLLKRLGVASPDWADLGFALIWILVTGSLAGAAWAWWDRRRQDPWQRLLRRVRAELVLRHLPAQPHHPPRTLAAMVRERFGAGGQAVAAALDALDLARYGPRAADRPDRAWWREFERRVRALKSAPH